MYCYLTIDYTYFQYFVFLFNLLNMPNIQIFDSQIIIISDAILQQNKNCHNKDNFLKDSLLYYEHRAEETL